MGFYSTEDNGRSSTSQRLGVWRWFAVVALSALIGSASTLAMAPALGLTNRDAVSADSRDSGAEPAITHANASPTGLKLMKSADGFTTTVKKVEPAVMGVVNYSQVSDFFSQNSKLQPAGVGTGVLFYKDDKSGYIVTNNHVVDGAAKVEVVLGSGKHVVVSVVGTDPFTDLAVLKIPAASVKTINPAEFANSDNIQVGEPAVAIGTPMGLDFADSVTAGIISAKKRIMPVQDPQSEQPLDYQAVIQTDAAINPGNSGGPLLNVEGQVVGINSSKIVAPNFEGMGFAIPANEVRTIAEQIMKTGHALHPALGIQGLSLSTIPDEYWPDVPVDYGVWVKSVDSVSAKSVDVQPQDVIVAINGQTVKTLADLRTYLLQMRPGQTVTLRIYRNSEQRTVQVRLGQMAAIRTTNASQNSGSEDVQDPFSIPNLFGN